MKKRIIVKSLIILILVCFLMYNLALLRKDLANQGFAWTIENTTRYILIVLISVGLSAWGNDKK